MRPGATNEGVAWGKTFLLNYWRITHFLATEVFRQATGVMSAGGSVCQIHDRPSEETPGHMAENHTLLATEVFR